MITTNEPKVTEYEQHQFDMLLWQADVHERNGRKREAFEIGVGCRFSEPGNRRKTNETQY
jgi:hypothetical protein